MNTQPIASDSNRLCKTISEFPISRTLSKHQAFRKRWGYAMALALLLFIPIGSTQAAQVVIDPVGVTPTGGTGPVTAADLVNKLVPSGSGISTANAVLTRDASGGLFSGGNAAGLNLLDTQTLGANMDEGIVLSTGNAETIEQLYTVESSDDFGTVAVRLSFDFSSNTDSIKFRFIFATEEDLGGTYADSFLLNINGSNVAFLPGTTTPIDATNLTPGVYGVVNSSGAQGTVFGPDGSYSNSGHSIVFEAVASGLNTGAGTPNTAEFVIADASDGSFDSAVFIEAGSFKANVTPDTDANLTASAVISEPVNLPSTADTVGEAVDVFDFTISDGGTADAVSTNISQIVVNTSGTGDFSKLTWRLNGPDVTNVTGTYSAGANTITFSGLSISVADGGAETYTVNAYYSSPTGLADNSTYLLSVDGDTDITLDADYTAMGTTSAVTNGSGSQTIVTATALSFNTQPSGSVSGSALTTQPVVRAVDASGNVDIDFSETVTLTEASPGTLSGNTAVASSGVATFSGLTYTATADQQSFTLTANDQDGVGTDLATVDANSVTSDVVATRLVFDTQPVPLIIDNGTLTAFTTVPVVSAQDAQNVVDTGYSTGITLAEVNGAGTATISGTGDTDGDGTTVTLTPSSGSATFTGLAMTYTASGGGSETFNLRVSSGALTAADSDQMTALVADSDGSLIAAPGVTEPVALTTSADTVGEAIDLFDFTLGDGGSADGLPMTISEISLNVSGTSTDAERAKVTWRLNGPDATNVTGTYNGASNTITFNGLGISIADGANETYTVNAYFNDGTNLTHGATIILAVDGDTDVVVGSNGTGMGTTSVVSNGTGSIITDNIVPTVTAVSLPANATYIAGQNLDFTVSFAENVSVDISGGVPRLVLTIGSTTRYAEYLSGTGSSALVFRYTVVSGDLDDNGISLSTTLDTNGGSITDAGSNTADNDISGFASLAAVLVDAQAPGVTITDDTVAIATGAVTYTFTFSEAVSGFSASDVTVAGGTKGTFSTVSSSVYTLVVNPPGGSTTSITVDVPANVATDVAGNNNTAATQVVQTVDTELPTLTSVAASSNNTDTTVAQVGDVVTLDFISSESLGSLPVVTIGGQSAAVTNPSGNLYSATRTIAIADVIGSPIVFSIDFADSAGNAGGQVTTVTSGGNVTKINTAPVNTVLPVVNGVVAVGQTITTNNGSWTDADNHTLSYSYQWRADGIAITGADTASYVVTSAEVGKTMTVVITADDGNGGSVDAISSGAVVVNTSPVNTVLPAISGNAVVGGVLAASTGNWSDVDLDTLTYGYQWKANGSDISGAITSSYTVTNNELGKLVSVTVTADDGKGGTVAVSSASTAAIDSDFDGDGTGDATDPDDDNDGMTDDWETANGLDPKDASDATTDSDGDGVSNLDEFTANSDPGQDDYPPVLTLPADVTLDADGLFTAISFSGATATDGKDGSIGVQVTHIASNGEAPRSVSSTPTHLSPGVHLLTWRAVDAAGNQVTGVQTVNVNPMVGLSKDQRTSEGSDVTFSVILNGSAASYPVEVPYTVGGSASLADGDHDLGSGTITIASGTQASVSFSVLDDATAEGSETIIVTLGTPVNAVKAPNDTMTVEVIEGNVPPVASVSAQQAGGSKTLTVVQGGGVVTISGAADDPDAGDVVSYDWSGSDNALVDVDSNEDSFSFDPSSLAPGVYTIRLTVSDGNDSDEVVLSLVVVESAPNLTASDTDEDGIDDQTEGFGDNDGDGIPDYLDAVSLANVLQEQVAITNSFLVETEPGLSLGLGHVAFSVESAQAEVSMQEIDSVEGVADRATNYRYPGGLFDFEISDLPLAGQSVDVTVAQLAPIPPKAVYRKLMPSGWQDFVIDANNAVASAAGEEGICPPPGDASYQPGLTEGHWCVQLTIEDGGANDADQTANRRISDPGGVAERLAEDFEVRVTNGSGPVGVMILGLLGFLMAVRIVNNCCRNRRVVLQGAVLGGLILATSSSAFAGDWWLGGNLARAQGDTSESALNTQLSNAGLNATATRNEDNRWAWQLFARYQYNDTWAAEVGYVDLGNIETTISGTSADVDQFLLQTSDIHPQTATGFQISGIYRYPIEVDTWVVGQVGAFIWESDYNLSTTNASRKVTDDGTSGFVGLGLQREVNDQNVFTLHLQRFSVDGESVLLMGGGWIYRWQ